VNTKHIPSFDLSNQGWRNQPSVPFSWWSGFVFV